VHRQETRCGIKNYTQNVSESVLNQSCLTILGNAKEICSAVENVLTLTNLTNKRFHKKVGRPILTQRRQHTIKDRNSSIIIRRVQCTGSAGGVFSQQFKPKQVPNSRSPVYELHSKGGMCNK